MIFPFPIFPKGESLGLFEYDDTKKSPTDLANAIIGNGITLTGTPTFSGTDSQAAFFVGGQNLGLAVTSGILLTTGDGTPPLENTATNAGLDVAGAGSPQLDAMLAASGVPNFIGTTTNDAVTLSFSFTATGGNAVKFNVLFGSEEYPEFADSFPDVAGVFVDGVNFAFFAGPSTPLSVLQSNIDSGYFKDNGDGTIPIEYDGMSHGLMIIALLDPNVTTHTISIAIADTGDHILDSGMFINNLTVETAQSGGVKQIVVASPGDDVISGGAPAEFAELDSGNDSMLGAGGDDFIKGNNGNDTIRGGDGFDQCVGDAGADLLAGGLNADTLQGGLGADTLQGGNGQDRLQGGNGADQLTGGAGADVITAGAGIDNLEGGGGNDTMTGGAGTDTFTFNDGSGDDQITDFTPVDDTVSVKAGINGSTLLTAADFYNALTDDGLGNVSLDLFGADVLFQGVTKAQMSAADFVVF
jgi:Ca2+-binding RTX toxin-like protein